MKMAYPRTIVLALSLSTIFSAHALDDMHQQDSAAQPTGAAFLVKSRPLEHLEAIWTLLRHKGLMKRNAIKLTDAFLRSNAIVLEISETDVGKAIAGRINDYESKVHQAMGREVDDGVPMVIDLLLDLDQWSRDLTVPSADEPRIIELFESLSFIASELVEGLEQGYPVNLSMWGRVHQKVGTFMEENPAVGPVTGLGLSFAVAGGVCYFVYPFGKKDGGGENSQSDIPGRVERRLGLSPKVNGPTHPQLSFSLSNWIPGPAHAYLVKLAASGFILEVNKRHNHPSRNYLKFQECY